MDNAFDLQLREAWAFRDRILPVAHSVNEFWSLATANWHAERLCRAASRYRCAKSIIEGFPEKRKHLL